MTATCIETNPHTMESAMINLTKPVNFTKRAKAGDK